MIKTKSWLFLCIKAKYIIILPYRNNFINFNHRMFRKCTYISLIYTKAYNNIWYVYTNSSIIPSIKSNLLRENLSSNNQHHHVGFIILRDIYRIWSQLCCEYTDYDALGRGKESFTRKCFPRIPLKMNTKENIS